MEQLLLLESSLVIFMSLFLLSLSLLDIGVPKDDNDKLLIVSKPDCTF